MKEEDLQAIESRWSDVRWTYGTTHYDSVYLQTHYGDLEADDDTEQANALRLASHAPADIQALVAEVRRLRAKLLHAASMKTIKGARVIVREALDETQA